MRQLTMPGARAGLVAVGLLVACAAPAAGACLPAKQVFAVREAAQTAFRQPSDLVLAGDRLLVLDDLNTRIVQLDLKGKEMGTIPLPAGGTSWLGMGFGGADQVFLASSGDGRVIVIDLRGRQVREFVVDEEGQAARPVGVFVAGASCFVTDARNKRVHVFTLDGKPLAAWGGPGEGPAQFRAPFRVVQDRLDRVLVADSLNSRVLAFTPKGDPLPGFGEFGVGEGTLFRPVALALLGQDRVLVSDNYFGSLQVFDAQGAYVGVLCSSEGRPLALENPTGVAARGDTVFVVEMGAGRVSAWQMTPR